MNKNGNSYTFIYASVMVVVVAALLSAAAISLKPKQVKNAEIEKKQNILASVHIEATATDAESLYEQNIQKAYVVNAAGEEVAGDAFTVDLKKERSKPLEQRILPVFECQTPEGLKYILPLRGTGLWGPIWGYLALNEDLNTIYGVNFDHQGETPGLGAEINTPAFQEPFRGKPFSMPRESWWPSSWPSQMRRPPQNTRSTPFQAGPSPVRGYSRCCWMISPLTKNSSPGKNQHYER